MIPRDRKAFVDRLISLNTWLEKRTENLTEIKTLRLTYTEKDGEFTVYINLVPFCIGRTWPYIERQLTIMHNVLNGILPL